MGRASLSTVLLAVILFCVESCGGGNQLYASCNMVQPPRMTNRDGFIGRKGGYMVYCRCGWSCMALQRGWEKESNTLVSGNGHGNLGAAEQRGYASPCASLHAYTVPLARHRPPLTFNKVGDPYQSGFRGLLCFLEVSISSVRRPSPSKSPLNVITCMRGYGGFSRNVGAIIPEDAHEPRVQQEARTIGRAPPTTG